MGRPVTAADLDRLLEEARASTGTRGIVGLGADVEPVASFENLPPDDPFLRRCFTEAERAYCEQGAAPAQRFAARFAAKEAVVKALGSTLRLLPGEVEIVRTTSGAPMARLRDGAAVGEHVAIHVSIGHTDALGYAVAVVTREHA